MQLTGLNLSQFWGCVLHVSHELYGGNVIMHADSKDLAGVRKPRCQARISVTGSHGPGSRTSWTGRHGPYACWHAYRDVLAEVFRRYPEAVIRTGIGSRVVYRGQEGFLATYPATRHVNIGSAFQPVTMPQLCECDSTVSGERDRELSGRQPQEITRELLRRQRISYEEVQRRSVALVADVKRRQAEIDREFPPDDGVFGPRVSQGTGFAY